MEKEKGLQAGSGGVSDEEEKRLREEDVRVNRGGFQSTGQLQLRLPKKDTNNDGTKSQTAKIATEQTRGGGSASRERMTGDSMSELVGGDTGIDDRERQVFGFYTASMDKGKGPQAGSRGVSDEEEKRLREENVRVNRGGFQSTGQLRLRLPLPKKDTNNDGAKSQTAEIAPEHTRGGGSEVRERAKRGSMSEPVGGDSGIDGQEHQVLGFKGGDGTGKLKGVADCIEEVECSPMPKRQRVHNVMINHGGYGASGSESRGRMKTRSTAALLARSVADVSTDNVAGEKSQSGKSAAEEAEGSGSKSREGGREKTCSACGNKLSGSYTGGDENEQPKKGKQAGKGRVDLAGSDEEEERSREDQRVDGNEKRAERTEEGDTSDRDRVRAWLNRLGFTEHIGRFESHEITYDLLETLTMRDLEKIGVAKLGHRKRLYLSFRYGFLR